MTVQNAPATDEYTAYEYATVRVPHTFEGSSRTRV